MDPDNPWYFRFQEAYQRATSDLEREILRDGVVTDAEYQEAVEAQRSCYQDLGVVLELSEDTLGAASMHGDASMTREELDAATEKCEPVGSEVTSIYHSMKINPDNEYFPDLVVECLKGLGVVPDDLTGDEWVASLDTYTPASEEADMCQVDPKGLLH